MDIDAKQDEMLEWGKRCFGIDHMRDRKVRAQRLLEEAIEFAQAVGVDKFRCARLLDYVYAKPAGDPAQELGGVGVTLLVAISSLEARASEVMGAEIERCLAKPEEQFAMRNRVKCEAGFK